MTLYNNKYRVETARLQGRDYSLSGYYFITICTQNRECLFCQIVDGKIELSEIGQIVKSEWLKSFEIRSELFCDEYCIMPDHVHAIIVIRNNVPSCSNVQSCGDVRSGNNGDEKCKRLPRSISSFLAGFKSSATRRINGHRQTPDLSVWQSRFHDRIIRNVNELNAIRQYIMENPLHWEK